MTTPDPYWELAVGVLMQAAHDLKHGSPVNKANARTDVASGGLDWWIDLVAEDNYSMGLRICKLFDELIKEKQKQWPGIAATVPIRSVRQ